MPKVSSLRRNSSENRYDCWPVSLCRHGGSRFSDCSWCL